MKNIILFLGIFMSIVVLSSCNKEKIWTKKFVGGYTGTVNTNDVATISINDLGGGELSVAISHTTITSQGSTSKNHLLKGKIENETLVISEEGNYNGSNLPSVGTFTISKDKLSGNFTYTFYSINFVVSATKN